MEVSKQINHLFFSVVIPTYNRAHLIGKAIESILNQTYKNFEIIVVDNHSTDNTEEVVKKYVDKWNIKFFKNDKNYERSFSRNRGLNEATGDYVTLLDSDDILYPDCLADAHQYILKHPDIRFFHFMYEAINEQHQFVEFIADYAPLHNPFKELMKGNSVSNIAVFYKNDVIKKVKFDETPIIIGIEDYDFVLRALIETKHLHRINKVNGGVLIHPNRSVNIEQWDRTYERWQYFLKKHLESASFIETFGPYKKIFLSNSNLFLCSFLAIRGHTLRAVAFLIKAIQHNFAIIFKAKFFKHIGIIIKYALK